MLTNPMSTSLISQKVNSRSSLSKHVPNHDSRRRRQSTYSIQRIGIILMSKADIMYPRNYSNRIRLYLKYGVTKLINKLQPLLNSHKLSINDRFVPRPHFGNHGEYHLKKTSQDCPYSNLPRSVLPPQAAAVSKKLI